MDISKEDLKEIIKQAIQEVSSKEPKLTLTIQEAIEISGIGEEKLRQLVHTKDFPCFKNGNKWCINREMLNEWLKKISVEHRQI
ncbi:DNA-binding protein [Clostridium estertheticum]|uniref:DNA-binding protein n=1 Tax=Clostridium estertheticum TaxID=238834 RepID=A0A5N7IQ73_9CLOT|nr:helix-turn-helix domain-containing protein [Clostridium estertheticum]MPQ32469.1 DNA-binding protein [Clostridium estertheticum]MPQ63128.1 DNA-binding protein [Clostridium estertheticum]